MIPLRNKELESYASHKNCHIWKKKFKEEHTNDKKKYCKVGDQCHYTGKYRDTAHSISYLK